MSFNQDPRLLALRLCPVFDRKLSVDDNLDKESAQNVRPWPDLELLLGTDGTYQSDVSADLMTAPFSHYLREIFCLLFIVVIRLL